MSRRLRQNTSANRVLRLSFGQSIGSNEVASQVAIDRWSRALVEYAINASATEPGGYLQILQGIAEEYYAACVTQVHDSIQAQATYPALALRVFNAYWAIAVAAMTPNVAAGGGAAVYPALVPPANPGLDNATYNAMIAAVDLVYNPIQAGAVAIAALPAAPAQPVLVIPTPQYVAPAAKPNEIQLAHYNQMLQPYLAIYTPIHTANAVPLNELPEMPDFPDISDTVFSQDEFDNMQTAILIAFAHSGFTGLGEYRQAVYFTVGGLPLINQMHSITVLQAAVLLPEGTTPRNIGAAFANSIARFAKANNIVFDWGRNNGVPLELGYLGFATWRFVTDITVLNSQVRTAMSQSTDISLRDSNRLEVEDPLAPHRVDTRDRDLRATRLHAAHQEVRQLPDQYDFHRGYRGNRLHQPPNQWIMDEEEDNPPPYQPQQQPQQQRRRRRPAPQ